MAPLDLAAPLAGPTAYSGLATPPTTPPESGVPGFLPGWLDFGWDILLDFWHVIERVYNVIVDGFHVVLKLIDDALAWIDYFFNLLFGWAKDLWGWVLNAEGFVVDHIEAFWENVWHKLGVLVEHGLPNLLGWLEHALLSITDWIWHNLILPVWHDALKGLGLAADLWREIEGKIKEIALALWHDVLAPTLHDLVVAILDAFGITVDAWHVIEKAWDWLVWFSEHTFDDIRALVAGPSDPTLRPSLHGITHLTDQDVTSLVDAFGSAFG